jgi:uncharacterized RDD family membrane protein YckC
VICPNCGFQNFAAVETCLSCGTILTKSNASKPAATNSDPFEGFVPDWMKPATQSTSSTTLHNNNINSNQPLSLDDLFTQGNTLLLGSTAPNATIPPVPMPSFSTSSNTSNNTSNQNQPPYSGPQWAGTGNSHPAGQSQWADTSSQGFRPGPTPQPQPTPSYAPPGFTRADQRPSQATINGLYRGCYYYFDSETSSTRAYQLAGLWSRIIGAIIDGILVFILNVIFWFVATIILSILVANAPDNDTAYYRSTSSPSFLENIGILMLPFMIGNMIPFLYHTGLVSMGGQTFGHRMSHILVVKRNSPTVGVVSAALRALWGLGYNFLIGVVAVLVWTVTIPILYASTIATNPNRAVSLNDFRLFASGTVLVFFLVYAVAIAIPLCMMAFTKSKQGMHDLLASTYVVYEKPILEEYSR